MLLDRFPAAVIALDRPLFVRYANLAAQRLAHAQNAKLRVGLQFSDFAGGALRETIATAFRRGFLSETQVALGDGRRLRVTGTVHGDLVVISLEHETESARRARAGEDFIVNAAHEFMTPLTSIAGAAHVLQDGAKDDPEVRDRFLQHIADGADRLIRVSRALLVLARAEAGLEPPRLELVRLEPLLADVLAAAGVANVDEVMTGSTSATVFADEDLLGIAVGALVHNALHHSRDGTLTVDVESGGGPQVAIEIANAGQLLPEEGVETLKTRFVSSGGRDGGGFGVGLSIAERALTLVDGRLSLRSVDGRTSVRIELPAGSSRR